MHFERFLNVCTKTVTLSCLQNIIHANPFDCRLTGKQFGSRELEILSLPGACVQQVYNFIHLLKIFLISSFICRGNDLSFFKKPTTTPASQVAHEIIDFANLLCHHAKVVYVLGIPERNESKIRSKQVNDFWQSVGERKTKYQQLGTWR